MAGEAIRTVAVMSPGDMGHAVGRVLREHGLRVITCLQGRSERSRGLAAQAGIEDVADEQALVREADALLSVLPPAQAHALAARIAAAVRATGADLLYVDCNAVAPQTVRAIAHEVEAAGARCVDAGIIGGPPRPGRVDAQTRGRGEADGQGPMRPGGPKFYASGEHAAELARLRDYGLDVRVIGEEIGQASGLKMCYGALTKGLAALATELLVAGEALGLGETLRAELRSSQGGIVEWLSRSVPGMPPKAYRWVGEMEEIAATFGALGLTPKMFEGAADLYRFVEGTELGKETPEARQRGQTLEEVARVLASSLPRMEW